MWYKCFVWHPFLRLYVSPCIVSNEVRLACQRDKLWLLLNRGFFVPFFGYHHPAHTGFFNNM